MSILQKVESAYQIILRALAILLMLALLGGAVMVGRYWLQAVPDSSTGQNLEFASNGTPQVSVDDIIKRVTEEDSSLDDLINKADPNHKSYEQIIATLEDFAKKYSVSEEEADLESFVSTLKYTMESQSSAALKTAYLQGLANTLDKTLADPKIIAKIRKPAPPGRVHSDSEAEEDDGLQDPMEMVGSIFQQYDSEFNRLAGNAASNSDASSEADQKQEHAYNMLIRWLGPFVLFILILQVLIFSRIEQNMRRNNSVNKE